MEMYMTYYRQLLLGTSPHPWHFTNHKGQGEHKHVHMDEKDAYEENGSHI
jgi:hypothetical protein